MTVDFECDKHDMDPYTAELMETARSIIEAGLSYMEWEKEPHLVTLQFIEIKVRLSSCLQLLTGCQGLDAVDVVDEVFDQYPESYVPWAVYKDSYLHKNKELLERINKIKKEEEGNV